MINSFDLQQCIPFYQIDAFSDGPFTGNPAAVCLLPKWPSDEILQKIAQENNLSETAFVVVENNQYLLRWFTPTTEVELCGHGTLAAACVLFERHRFTGEQISFHTLSGILTVKKDKTDYIMDFPLVYPTLTTTPPELLSALGLKEDKAEIWEASDLIVVIDDENKLDTLTPNFAALEKFNTRGVVVTASSQKFDFRSRWFGPQVGVNEDPVTGSAHTFLAPLWANKLSKNTLHAQQGGHRKGELVCRIMDNGRVELSGKAYIIVEGSFLLNI